METTYYFNGHSASAWTDPNNFDDGNIATFASVSSDSDIHEFNSNTCPGTDLGTITKVELRVYGKGDGNDQIELTPVFAGGDGDVHETVPVVDPGGWTAYVDITTDTNAPSPWTWAAVQALDCDANRDAVSKANTMYGSKVEIRVTHDWKAPVSDIDVGADPIERGTNTYGNSTWVDKNNPANASGVLHSIQISVKPDYPLRGLIVGTFYTTNGNTLKCRDSEYIGDVAEGFQTITNLSITVQEGDYIGCFFDFPGCRIEADTFGGSGLWRVSGEYIDPGDEATYSFAPTDRTSLYGYGDIEEPPPDIDVGADATDRASNYGFGYTFVSKDNPANDSGIIHSVRIWANSNLFNLVVGTFYTTNGNTLKCRDSEAIGAVEIGFHEITELSIAVQEGDYIGCYYTSGTIKIDTEGYDGLWSINEEHIDPGDEAVFFLLEGDAMSLIGYGDIEAPPEVGLENKSANMAAKMVAAGLI